MGLQIRRLPFPNLQLYVFTNLKGHINYENHIYALYLNGKARQGGAFVIMLDKNIISSLFLQQGTFPAPQP